MRQNVQFIDGQWQESKGRELVSLNPVTGEVVWSAKSAEREDVNRAIEAAHKAFPRWSSLSPGERIAVLMRFEENLKAHKDEFAEMISKETGKPYWESLTEVASMAAKVPISIEAYHERAGEKVRDLGEKKSLTRFKPHGVVAVIGPYNFPGHLPNGHIVPALLAGNTVIFKPSSLTPAVAQKTVELWEKSGVPNGVINLIQGRRDLGDAITQNNKIHGLFFTGSTTAGLSFMKAFADRPQVILALEMGGNNPLVVTDVADKKAASFLTVQSSFITAGQRCTCARRLIVPVGKEGDEFVQTLIRDIQTIQVGAYQDRPEPFMGSVISKSAAEEVLRAQESLIQRNGEGLVLSKSLRPHSALISPGLIDVTHVKDREDEEIFGPLLQLIRVKDFEAAIEEANNTKYGLSAGIFCDKRELFETYYHRVHAGVINWNEPLTGAASSAPFGGTRASGNHRPSAYFAADYCSYPVASLEAPELKIPKVLPPGLR